MTRTKPDYSPPRDPGERETFARIVALAFGGTVQGARDYLHDAGDTLRLVRHKDTGEVLGGLRFVPMGQFFGGRRVSMTGVACVAIAPHARSGGVATALMKAAVAELKDTGVALSTLYPATYPLYRRVGYEICGGQYQMSIPVSGLIRGGAALPMRPIEASDMRAIKALYRRHAMHRQGWLDRNDFIWARAQRAHGEHEVYGQLVTGEEGVEGYVLYRQPPGKKGGYELAAIDMVCGSLAAAERLIGFFASHRSQASRLSWYGGIDDPLLFSLKERGCQVSQAHVWMLCLTDIARALHERGYPPGVSARLDLEIELEAGERATGGKRQGLRYIVEVADGEAEARMGGRGSLRMGVGALTAIYSGHMSPRQLHALGAVSGSPGAITAASALFASAPPSMPDFF